MTQAIAKPKATVAQKNRKMTKNRWRRRRCRSCEPSVIDFRSAGRLALPDQRKENKIVSIRNGFWDLNSYIGAVERAVVNVYYHIAVRIVVQQAVVLQKHFCILFQFLKFECSLYCMTTVLLHMLHTLLTVSSCLGWPIFELL